MMNPDGDIYLVLNSETGWVLVTLKDGQTTRQPLRGPVHFKVLSGVLKAQERESDGQVYSYFGDAAKKKVSEWPQDHQNGPDRVEGVEYEVELTTTERPVVGRLWACTNGLKHLGLIVGDEVVVGFKRKPLPEGVAEHRRRDGRPTTYLAPVAWGLPDQPRRRPDQDKIDETFDRR